MADDDLNIADEVKAWMNDLENMKKINFFPYLSTDPVKGGTEVIEFKREDCSNGNHCGEC